MKMNNTANRKVPLAILCCFLIAFLVQGAFKLSGIFIFDKALDWQIFAIIDNSIFLSILYYSILMFLTMCCLSFTLRRYIFSKCWYHYIIMLVLSFTVITIQYLTGIILDTRLSIIFDILTYIITPLIIYFTTPKSDRVFNKYTVTNVTIIIMLQISLYFLYLGLNYWSGILNSIIPDAIYTISSSALFLTQLEVYTGLIFIMLSMNIFINKFIKEDV